MTRFNRYLWPLVIGLPVVLMAQAAVARVHIESETMIRYFERDTATDTDTAIVPIYEFLGIETEAEEGADLSLHLYGWGRHGTSEEYFRDDETRGELMYAYAQYASPNSAFIARLGRMHVLEGITNDTLDGARVLVNFNAFFAASAYAGQPYSLEKINGRTGDLITGGRLSHSMGALYDVGLSVKHLVNDGEVEEASTGVDFVLTPPINFFVQGTSVYNHNVGTWSEHYIFAQLFLGPLRFEPFYQKFDYEGFFETGKNTGAPFHNLTESADVLTVYGATLGAYYSDTFKLEFKGRDYSYDISNESANYYSAIVTGKPLPGLDIGLEVGRMEGDSADNRYTLFRAYAYDKIKLGFISGEFLLADYDEPILGEDTSLFASLGAGVDDIFWGLSAKLSADYSSDPYFDEDVRGLLTIAWEYDK